MQLVINISDYDMEYINNAHDIPKDISLSIAEAILDGKVIPPHGRLIDIKSVEDGKFVNADNEYQKWWNGALEGVINYAPTIIEAEGR